MKPRTHRRPASPLIAALLLVAGACSGGDDETADAATSPSQQASTGSPCTKNDDCQAGFCITNDTFKAVTEGSEAEIPGGYCSKLACRKGGGDEECGPGAYCFSLEQYLPTALGVCGKVCKSVTDCRDGYVCTDGSGPQFQPLPFSVCLSPSVLCLLDIPHPSCPPPEGGTDAGAADAGSDAADGATNAGGD